MDMIALAQEIIDGKREVSDMEEDINATLTQVVDYTDKTEKKKKIGLVAFLMSGMVCLIAEFLFYLYSVPITIPVVEFISIFGISMAIAWAIVLMEEYKIFTIKHKKEKEDSNDKWKGVLGIFAIITWFLIALFRSILMFIR